MLKLMGKKILTILRSKNFVYLNLCLSIAKNLQYCQEDSKDTDQPGHLHRLLVVHAILPGKGPTDVDDAPAPAC